MAKFEKQVAVRVVSTGAMYREYGNIEIFHGSNPYQFTSYLDGLRDDVWRKGSLTFEDGETVPSKPFKCSIGAFSCASAGDTFTSYAGDDIHVQQTDGDSGTRVIFGPSGGSMYIVSSASVTGVTEDGEELFAQYGTDHHFWLLPMPVPLPASA